jgi:hypothetical protein
MHSIHDSRVYLVTIIDVDVTILRPSIRYPPEEYLEKPEFDRANTLKCKRDDYRKIATERWPLRYASLRTFKGQVNNERWGRKRVPEIDLLFNSILHDDGVFPSLSRVRHFFCESPLQYLLVL